MWWQCNDPSAGSMPAVLSQEASPFNEFLYLIDYMMLLPLSGWRSNA